MFVGTATPAARRAVMDLARRCFRVDANLRPEGRDGPLVRSVDSSYEAYWERWAQPWEFQALLKAAPVAGDPELGAAFGDAARRAPCGAGACRADDLRSLRAMKARAEAEVARQGLADREVKRGPGGIRDIEFAVQLLQLVHGRARPRAAVARPRSRPGRAGGRRLRRPPTTPTAWPTPTGSCAGSSTAAAARTSSRSTPCPPTGTSAGALARVLGYRGTPEAGARPRRSTATCAAAPRPGPGDPRAPLLPPAAGGARPGPARCRPRRRPSALAAFGFTDVERTGQAVRELTRGLTRSSRLMQQLLPLLLDWLSETPDPDLGLLGLRKLASGEQRVDRAGPRLPGVARGRPGACAAARHQPAARRDPRAPTPTSSPALGRRRPPADPRPPTPWSRRPATPLAWRDDLGERQRALRRWRDRHLLRIARPRRARPRPTWRRSAATSPRWPRRRSRRRSPQLDPQVPFAVVALGRFGGGELSYASDLDVLFVYDGDAGDDGAEARWPRGSLRFLAGTTPAQRIYAVDADLRPEGARGRWPAASTATAPTSSAGPRRGSARR